MIKLMDILEGKLTEIDSFKYQKHGSHGKAKVDWLNLVNSREGVDWKKYNKLTDKGKSVIFFTRKDPKGFVWQKGNAREVQATDYSGKKFSSIKYDKFYKILIEGKLTEGKWGVKGKYLTMPGGELSSIPGNNDRDAIAVDIGRDEFKIHMSNSKPYAYGPKYDKSFKNVKDLVKWLNKERAKYAGIDDR